jgi:HK97 family phage prohead protease
MKTTIVIDASALRARERMFSKYGARLGRDGPRFAKSNVAKVDDADDEPRLCIEGIGISFGKLIVNKFGETILFEPNSFDKYFSTGKRPDFQLSHDPTKVFGSNTELCILDEGVAFRLPLANKSYAATIKQMVESGEQACISIGFTELRTRDEVHFGHKVKHIEEAEIREISLCPRGACKQGFARIIDANSEPPLHESVNTAMFGIEFGLHNIKIIKEDNDIAVDWLKHKLSTLDGEHQHNEPQSSAPSMTTGQGNRLVTDSYDRMRAERRTKLLGK